MHFKRFASIFCAISLMAPATAAVQAEEQTPPAATPVGLYHHVWQLINEVYVDSTFNGQDWKRWEHRYDKDLKTLDDSRKGIETMLASLGDRYTRYLDPSAFVDEKQQISSKLTGVGIQLGLNKEQKLTAVAPIEDMPAARAGVMANDEIIEIDDKPTTGLSVDQASKRIRGPIGTSVKLTVLRGDQRLVFNITRDEIPIKSVHAVKMLNNEIGYIQLSTFMSERAFEEIRAALDKLSPARGIIIDLRNNPGGLVTNALAICSMFLDGGIIVTTMRRGVGPEYSRASGHPISHQPLVVLINGGSASASEITSGALHDSKRAALVGEKSFGKGLVQSITMLEDGSGVNITIARYVTPNNTDIHKKGIVPDIKVELKKDDYAKGFGPWFIYPDNKLEPPALDSLKDTQLKTAINVLEERMHTDALPKLELKFSPFPTTSPVRLGPNFGQQE
jgi:carboxyl-terminal processing protease